MTAPEEEGPAQFFVRALFDFVGNDASSLSFQRGDIIEVLNTLPSGWWDGLLDEERGWFPSNYVQQIPDEEAEQELSARDLARLQQQQREQQHMLAQQQEQIAAAAHHQRQQQQQRFEQNQYGQDNRDWMDHTRPSNTTSPQRGNGVQPAHDYWMPQVTGNGQVRRALAC